MEEVIEGNVWSHLVLDREDGAVLEIGRGEEVVDLVCCATFVNVVPRVVSV